MIDIHNHILPGIDDGAQTLEDSLALLQRAVDDGVTHLVCTPHMHAGRFDNDITTIKPAFELLHKRVVEEELPIEIAMAAEIRISDDFMVQLKQGKVPFLGQLGQKSVVLLEMPHERVPLGLDNLLRWLDRQDIAAIIAHPERNKELMSYPSRSMKLAENGALFQLTAASVVGKMGDAAQRTAHWFLDHNLAFCVASDAHNIKYRPSAMAAAYKALKQSYGDALADELCVSNPRLLTESLFETK